MKTKTIFKMLAAAMLMPTMLLTTACSSDDDAIINNNETPAKKGYTLPVTINVTRQSEAATRATYTDNGNKTGSLSFSTGDKLFVTGAWEDDDDNYYCYAGMLDYVSDGTFSGTIITETEWTGTIEGLLSGANATLLPAGYKEYGYLSIADEGTYEAYLIENSNKAFATSKATAVEQFSYEYDNSYSSSFELIPTNAILNFTINGLDASTEVNVSFSYPNYPDPIVISGKVTTDGDGTATFAIGIKYRDNLNECTLTVGGNAITLPADKEVEAGHIYNIRRSVAPAGPTAYSLAESTVGMIVGSDGNAYAVADKDNLPTGVTAVAMVAYKSANAGESLAIALSDEVVDEDGEMSWSLAKSTCEHKDAIGGIPWKLPSMAEWNQMFGADVDAYEAYYTDLNTAITNAGGTALHEYDESEDRFVYWSSTVVNELAWVVVLYEGDAVWYNYWYKDSLVRACLAF